VREPAEPYKAPESASEFPWIAVISPNAPHYNRKGRVFESALEAAKYIIEDVAAYKNKQTELGRREWEIHFVDEDGDMLLSFRANESTPWIFHRENGSRRGQKLYDKTTYVSLPADAREFLEQWLSSWGLDKPAERRPLNQPMIE
jgi:hypothetical protein